VRLQDVATGPRKAIPRTTGNATGAVPRIALQAAAASSLHDETHGSDAPVGPLVPVTVKSTRRHTAVIAVMVAALVALVIVIIVLATGDDEGGANKRAARTGGGYDDLGRSIDDPRIVRGSGTGAATGTGSGSETVAVKTPRNPRTPRSGTSGSNQQTGNGTGPGTGKTEMVLSGDGELEPLTPDDVVSQAQRNATGTQRCYERALKKDPFIKVKSIAALVTIGSDGKVSDVTLDQMQSEPLGQCLVAAIKRWGFRKSTEGINTKITLKFEQTLGP
jgi:hypothetical protein